MTGNVTIAGIGPGGSVEQLTVEALASIRNATLVIYAGTMISAAIRAEVRGELLWGSALTDALMREKLLSVVAAGGSVVWLEPGDPSVYSGEPGVFSTASENAAWLRSKGISFRVLPGVSSLHALTSRLGLDHAGNASGMPLVVYAPERDPQEVAAERLNALLALRVPVAFYLGIRWLKEIVQRTAQHHGSSARIVLGHRVGWPEERIIDSNVSAILDITDGSDLPRQTLVLVGPWLGGTTISRA